MSSRTNKTGSVVLFGNTYTIEYYDALEDAANEYGETDIHEKIIKVSLLKNNSKKKLHSTLFHEVLHGLMGESGVSQMLSSEQEEAVVVCLENSLLKLVDFKPHVLKKMENGNSD